MAVIRSLVVLVLGASLYGFSIGIANSLVYALRNLAKFPLLVLGTTLLCALSHHVVGRLLQSQLGFVQIQRAVLGMFRDTALLLGSLSPVMCFLALAMERPNGRDLGGYPLFQGLNVVAIAGCGGMAVLRGARTGLLATVAPATRRNVLLAAWLLVSLAIGGQLAWGMRPFFGISGPGNRDTPWFHGFGPDFRGAGSFYEACWFLVSPPDGWSSR